MRQPARFLILILVMCASFGVSRADDRADARTHYQAGVKSYSAGDYKTAIKEFGAAQQLAPADLNNYNLALCYDKLGEAEPAIQYYKEYLNKVPDAPKRAEIEASIARLDGALKSQSAKKADEQKKIDDAKKAEEAKKAQADDAKKAEDAKKADDAKHPPIGPVAPDVVPPPTGVGSTGTPSTGLTVSTGDSQLDKVSAIDINAIRDQRVGGASSGLPDRAGGPATNPSTGVGGPPPPNGGPQPNGMAGTGPNNAQQPNNMQQPADKPAAPQETPVYKKWWFWVVVGVTAFVIIDIAASGSNNNQATVGRLNNRETLPLNSPGAGFSSGGYTLLHF